jgi:Na+-driven multidrug efflux pump
MEVAGAALATLISKVVGFIILLWPYIRKKSIVRLAPRRVSFAKDIVREISFMGFPSLMRMGLSVVCLLLINRLAGQYSDSALAGITVVTRIMMLPNMALLGFAQGFMPVAGYNWGAQCYHRVRLAFRFSSLCAVVFMSVCAVLLCVFSEQVIYLFTEADAEMVRVGKFCLLTQAVILPLNGFVMTVNFLYSALGKAVGATLLSIQRQGICFIPLYFILPAIWMEMGLAATQAAADVLCFIIVIPFAVSALRFIRRTEKNDLNMPEPVNGGETP